MADGTIYVVVVARRADSDPGSDLGVRRIALSDRRIGRANGSRERAPDDKAPAKPITVPQALKLMGFAALYPSYGLLFDPTKKAAIAAAFSLPVLSSIHYRQSPRARCCRARNLPRPRH